MSFLFWSTTQRTDRKRQQPSVARAGQKGLPCMPTYANSRFKREATCAFTLNFWQRYASHATAAEDACIANEGHGDCSVAKLCFPIGKIILPVTIIFGGVAKIFGEEPGKQTEGSCRAWEFSRSQARENWAQEKICAIQTSGGTLKQRISPKLDGNAVHSPK